MNLLVDLGNSRLKWARAAPGQWATGTVLHAQQDLAALLDGAWAELEKPKRILMASVAADTTRDALAEWCRCRWALEPLVIRAQQEQLGVKHCYARPETFGADRWAALIAVRGLTQANACIVDCGTAVTVDALAASGEFRGGAIFPGLRLLRESLLRGTGGIHGVEGKVDTALGCSTPDAVAGGTQHGLIGAVALLVAEQIAALGGEAEVFLTGGDAPLVRGHLKPPVREVPDLVLKGLARIAAIG
jgi:type III pantothenate kinase